MCVAAEHLPIFVACDERDLLDGKTGFEEAACALVPEVMKVKVFDLELATLAPERRSHGFSIERKDAAAAFAYARTLLRYDRAGVVARDVEQRNALVIPALSARILAISNEEHLYMRGEVSPVNSADFVLPHRGCDRKADDPTDRNLLAGICFECSDQAIQLILRRSSHARSLSQRDQGAPAQFARGQQARPRVSRRQLRPRAIEWC